MEKEEILRQQMKDVKKAHKKDEKIVEKEVWDAVTIEVNENKGDIETRIEKNMAAKRTLVDA